MRLLGQTFTVRVRTEQTKTQTHRQTRPKTVSRRIRPMVTSTQTFSHLTNDIRNALHFAALISCSFCTSKVPVLKQAAEQTRL